MKTATKNIYHSPEMRHGLAVGFAVADWRRALVTRQTTTWPTTHVTNNFSLLTLAAARRVPALKKILANTLKQPAQDSAEANLRRVTTKPLIAVLPPNATGDLTLDIDLTKQPRHARVLVVAQAGARGTVTVRCFGNKEANATVSLSAYVGRRADLTLLTLSDFPVAASGAWWRQATVEAKGQLRCLDGYIGRGHIWSRTTVKLTGVGASAKCRSLLLLDGHGQADLSTEIWGLADNTIAEIDGRQALGGAAKANARHFIHIPRGRTGCQGHEKSATLLLSSGAEFSSQPEFEVNAAAVQCGHSASIGHLNRDQKFYLQSRGLSAAQATRYLVEAMSEPFLSELTAGHAEETVRCLIGHHIAKNL